MIVLALAIIVILLFFQSLERERRALVDINTFCPKSEGVTVWGFHRIDPPPFPGETAIVIDATDSLNLKVRAALKKYFNGDKYLSSLKDFERVRVYAMKEFVGALAEPSFDLCVPPNKNVSPWLDNPRKRREAFEKQFVSTFVKTIDALAQREEANRSPILETLALVSKDNKRIIIVSDLMQHGDKCSLYQNGGRHDYNAFRRDGCIEFDDNLSETEIDVLFVSREKLQRLQNPRLIEFWKKHFESNGASAHFRPLEAIDSSCVDTHDASRCMECLTDEWVNDYNYCQDLFKEVFAAD